MLKQAIVACATAALALSAAGLVRADEAGDQLKARVVDAYSKTQTYSATVSFRFEQRSGRWTRTEGTDFEVALDRPANRVLIDKPEMVLASDGKKLRIVAAEFAGHHVEIDAPQAITFEVLAEAMSVPNMGSFLTRPMMIPEVAMLTTADPLAQFTGPLAQVEFKALEPEAGDAMKRPGLQFAGDKGTWTFRIDPRTNLISGATLAIAGTAGGDGEYARMVYHTTIHQHNEPVAAEKFALKTADSEPSATLAELVAAAAGLQRGGVGGGGAHPLVGHDAPAINLKTVDGKPFDLSKVKADVIILDFWATWCGPCRQALPGLQKVQDWATKNKKSVQIFTVNLQENPQAVVAYWTDSKFTMPVLMDADGRVAAAYNVESIPQTVLITGGKVADVHIGLAPDQEAKLKTQIDELLKAAAEKRQN